MQFFNNLSNTAFCPTRYKVLASPTLLSARVSTCTLDWAATTSSRYKVTTRHKATTSSSREEVAFPLAYFITAHMDPRNIGISTVLIPH